jgi:hypothetical protein
VELRVWECPLHCPYGKRAHVAQGPVLVVVVPGFRSLEWVSEEIKLSGFLNSIRKAALAGTIHYTKYKSKLSGISGIH